MNFQIIWNIGQINLHYTARITRFICPDLAFSHLSVQIDFYSEDNDSIYNRKKFFSWKLERVTATLAFFVIFMGDFIWLSQSMLYPLTFVFFFGEWTFPVNEITEINNDNSADLSNKWNYRNKQRWCIATHDLSIDCSNSRTVIHITNSSCCT